MRKKITYIVCAITALMAVNQAFAQSSHDAVSGPDADFADNTSKFEIGSPDGNYKLGFGGHLQWNNNFTYRPETKIKDFNTEISRARLKLYGSAFDPSITYLLQVQFEEPGTAGGRVTAPANHYPVKGSSTLRDYYVNAAINPEFFHVRVGKFRTPFSRQQLISSSQMQFNDQNSSNNAFQLTKDGHDIGLMFHNGFHDPIEWAFAAVSNGLVARVGYNYGEIDGYDFADFSGGGLRFGVALNGFAHSNYKNTEFKKDLRGGADFIVKYEGLSTNGAFYYRRANDKNEFGGGLDAGYLIKGRYEPVVRYSWVKDDQPHNQEIRGGFNYYIYGHHLKVQSYVGPDLIGSKFVKWEGGAQLQFAL